MNRVYDMKIDGKLTTYEYLCFLKWPSLLLILGVLFYITHTLKINLFEQKDLIAFWSGTKAFLQRVGPYSYDNLLTLQQSVFPDKTIAEYFLNPPWALPLMSILFFGSYEFVSMTWPIVNIVLWIWTVFLFQSLNKIPISKAQVVLNSLLFIPLYTCLIFGQMGILMLFFCVATIVGLKNNRDTLAGFCFSILSLKPQLFFLLAVCLAIWLVRSKRYKFFVSALTAFGLLNLIPFLYHPQIYTEWLSSDYSPIWLQTATLATMTRFLINDWTGSLHNWPVLFFPLVGLALVLLWQYRTSWQLDLRRHTGFLIAASIIFAPYAWPHDFVILYPLVYFFTLDTVAVRAEGKMLLYGYLLVSQTAIFIGPFFINNLAGLFWYPIFLFCFASAYHHHLQSKP